MRTRFLIIRFLLAWLGCFSLASLMHSQFVLAGLTGQGIQIALTDRLQMSLSDWWGLLPTYGLIIAIGLLLAFSIAGWLSRRFSINAVFLYPLAGFVTLLCIHLAMQPIMDITLIAGARGALGLLTQAATGLAGGWIFAKFRNLRQA
ncbi:hypothetical protein [Bowmanella yangjiangensis]|uniref:Major facilitator superfamily (MFS) profile domain-containing protein n=1 Tax=Bowmanella yangjiangensis TaxID=2811230 RepID=A0ABS3CR02_9ALTE|nr:hypothetical protein [Bowmanella yangjiangensis]MBN7818725.1 hypothetical protein [Bowmanella yangjiangensis]